MRSFCSVLKIRKNKQINCAFADLYPTLCLVIFSYCSLHVILLYSYILQLPVVNCSLLDSRLDEFSAVDLRQN